MDPLVRAALVTQNLLGRGLIMGLNVGSGVVLILFQMGRAPGWCLWFVLAALGLTLTQQLRRRRRYATHSIRRDLELFTLLFLLVKDALLLAGPVYGPAWSPLVYVVFMLAAAFAQSGAAFGTLGFALAFEAARLGATQPGQWFELLWPQAALGVAFTSLNFLVFRAEIARVR